MSTLVENPTRKIPVRFSWTDGDAADIYSATAEIGGRQIEGISHLYKQLRGVQIHEENTLRATLRELKSNLETAGILREGDEFILEISIGNIDKATNDSPLWVSLSGNGPLNISDVGTN